LRKPNIHVYAYKDLKNIIERQALFWNLYNIKNTFSNHLKDLKLAIYDIFVDPVYLATILLVTLLLLFIIRLLD
jgi:hypothetical protein